MAPQVKGALLREALLSCSVELWERGRSRRSWVLRLLEGLIGPLNLAFLFLILDCKFNSLAYHIPPAPFKYTFVISTFSPEEFYQGWMLSCTV